MILDIFAWIGIAIALFIFGLLIIPIRISGVGGINDQKGIDYQLNLNWAFGVLSVRAVTGRPMGIYLLGICLGRMPLKTEKRKKTDSTAVKTKASPWSWLRWMRWNFTDINHILSRFAHAGMLHGYLYAEIGLAEPADTAMLGQLARLIRIDGRRFRLLITTVYEYETINIRAQIRSTIIIAYLGMVVLGLFLQKRIRLMLRGVPKSVKKEV